MGLLFSTFYNTLIRFCGLKARILMAGLDTAGKTTILYKLKLKRTVTTIPTIGYNDETVHPKWNVSFKVLDVGGQDNIRVLWTHFFTKTDGLVFVVDSAAPERFQEARSELVAIIEDKDMQGVPFVVLANKQDLPGASSCSELVEKLGLQKFRGHEWHVQGCCGTTGEGLVEGLKKLAEMVKLYRKTRATRS